MNTTGLQKIKKDWLISAINWDDYNIPEPTTDGEKLQFLADCINSEVKLKGNIQNALADYLMGLPSWLDIPFYNEDILNLLNSWGYEFKTERAEGLALERYWGGVAFIMLQLFRKYNIKIEGL